MALYNGNTISFSSKGPLPTNYFARKYRQLVRRAQLEYYRYEVTFSLYIMTYHEKMVVNLFVLLVLGLLTAAIFYYLPSLAFRSLQRVTWYFYGSQLGLGGQLSSLVTSSANGVRQAAAATAASFRRNLTGEL